MGDDPPQQEPGEAETPPAGRTRKRRLTTNRQDPYSLRKPKMTAHSPKATRTSTGGTPNLSAPTATPTPPPNQPDAQADLLKHLQTLIDNAEKRQTVRIQDTIKELKTDLGSRIDSADRAIKKLQDELKSTKRQVEEVRSRADERLEEKILKVVQAGPTPPVTLRRPRPPLNGANAIPIDQPAD